MIKHECDVLVVGAGIVGSAAAYHLKHRCPDLDILLLDRAGVAQGNTGKSVSMIRNSFTSPPSFALAHATIHEYRRLHEATPGGIDLNQMMYLWLLTQEQAERAEEGIKALAARGADLELMTTARLGEVAPCLRVTPDDEESAAYELPSLHTGLLCRDGYSVDPVAITQWYVDRFREAGGKTVFGVEVQDFVRRPRHPLTFDGDEIPGQPFGAQAQTIAGVKLTDGATLSAGTTLLAVGAWSRELTDRLGAGSLLSPKKRQWFYVEGPALAPLFDLPAFGNQDGTLPFTVLPQGIYIKLSREGGAYLALADNIGRPFSLDTRPERDYFLNTIFPTVKGYFPQFENVTLKAMDAGSYCYDEVYRTPIVDWLHSGIMLASGCSGSGIMKADAIGRITAHRYLLGVDGNGLEDTHLALPAGVGIDTNDLTIRGRARIEPEQFVI